MALCSILFSMDPKELAKHLDLANHHPNSTPQDIRLLCQKVIQYGFNSAFVNPFYVPLARKLLGSSGKVGTVVSFPLGQETLETKVSATRQSASLGADELDVSLNVGRLKAGEFEESLQEMEQIVQAVKTIDPKKIVKFILETSYLIPDEIIKASQLVVKSGADFVKSDSGMGPHGATVENIKIIKQTVGDKVKVKAAGGIETYPEAIAILTAGADRIGTSHAVEIVQNSSSKEPTTNQSE